MTEPGTPDDPGTPIPDEVARDCKALLCELVDRALDGDQYALLRACAGLTDHDDLIVALTHRCGRAIQARKGRR